MEKDIKLIGNTNKLASVLWGGTPKIWGDSGISPEDINKWIKGATRTLQGLYDSIDEENSGGYEQYILGDVINLLSATNFEEN